MPSTHRERPSESGFMLSPIHKTSDLTTTSGASAKPIFVPHQLPKTGLTPLDTKNTSRDLNTSGTSKSSHQSGELESFTLSPIPTGLEARAGGQFKSSIKPLATLHSSAVNEPEDVLLSPVYAKQPMTSETRKKPENRRKPNTKELTLSPIRAQDDSAQRVHTEGSTGDHQQWTICMPSAEIPSPLSFISSGTYTGSGTHDSTSKGDKKVPDVSSQEEENEQALAVDQENSDMETDVAELQSALKDAGMTKLSQFSTTTELQSPDNHELSSTNAVKEPAVHAEDSHFRGLHVEQTIRAIATEELASLTREIILQDLEPGAKLELSTAHVDTPQSHTPSDTLPTTLGIDLTGEQPSAKPTSELKEGFCTTHSSRLKKSVPETQKSVSSRRSQKQSRKSGQSPAGFEQVKPKQQFTTGKKSGNQSVKRKPVPSGHPPDRSKIASSALRHPGWKSPHPGKTVSSPVTSFHKSHSLTTTTGDADSTANAGSSKKGNSSQESESMKLLTGCLQNEVSVRSFCS